MRCFEELGGRRLASGAPGRVRGPGDDPPLSNSDLHRHQHYSKENSCAAARSQLVACLPRPNGKSASSRFAPASLEAAIPAVSPRKGLGQQ